VSARRRKGERLRAPDVDYRDADGNVLTLRSSLSVGSRQEYQRALAGGPTIAGAPIDRQNELLARLRVASSSERAWVRETLRRHCAEHFPDVRAP